MTPRTMTPPQALLLAMLRAARARGESPCVRRARPGERTRWLRWGELQAHHRTVAALERLGLLCRAGSGWVLTVAGVDATRPAWALAA